MGQIMFEIGLILFGVVSVAVALLMMEDLQEEETKAVNLELVRPEVLDGPDLRSTTKNGRSTNACSWT